jgi:Tfp pilus assembly protein FimT
MGRLQQAGFTVVEVFLGITLLGIIVTLMVVPIQQMTEQIHVRPLEETFLSVVRKAHMEARQRNMSVVLHYVGESNLLELATADGVLIDEIDLQAASGEEDTELLKFCRILPEDPKNESIAYESEEETIDSIVFHPTGASTPFAVELTQKDIRLVMDPFSSEPLIREVEGHES